MTDYSQALTDIKNAVSAAVPGVPIVQTHSEGVSIVEGIPQSYIVLTFGGPIKYQRDRGIVAGSKNPNVMWVTCQAVAAMPTLANRIKQDILNALEDFCPDNSSRMTPDGGFANDTSDDSTKPVRYISAIRFSFIHNLRTA